LLEVVQVAGDQRRQQPGAEDQRDVLRVLRPADREIAEDQVAQRAAAERGDEGDHRDPENIHLPASRRQCAGHRLGGNRDQVDAGQRVEGGEGGGEGAGRQPGRSKRQGGHGGGSQVGAGTAKRRRQQGGYFSPCPFT